jgi:hypothetical protein
MAFREPDFTGLPIIKEINENKFLNATGQYKNTGVINVCEQSSAVKGNIFSGSQKVIAFYAT